MEFRQTALENRYLLLLALSALRKNQGSGAANTAYEITTQAIKWGYVESRESPAGAMLERWIKNRNPPAWAAKASARILADEVEYTPKSKEEQQAFALMLAEALPDLAAHALISLVNPALSQILDPALIGQACENRR